MCLRPPHVGRSREHRAAHRGIGNDRRIEFGGLAVEERVANPVPVRDRPVAEIHVLALPGEGVEAEVPVRGVEPGLTAIADHRLRPRDAVPVRLPRAVVLRAAQDVVDIEPAIREALELQGR